MASSLATLQSLAVACEGDMKVLRRRAADVGVTAECLVRRTVGEDDFLEVRLVGRILEGEHTFYCEFCVFQ